MLQDISRPKVNKTKNNTKPLKQQPWQDLELDQAKACKYKLLRLWRKTNCDRDKLKYKTARNHFKALCRLKKSKHSKILKDKLENCVTPAEFWKIIQAHRRRKQCFNYVSGEQWELYFSDLSVQMSQ